MTQNDLTYQAKITELRLDITHPKNRGKVFMLLEGESDTKVYRKLCREDSVKTEWIPEGKTKLVEGLKELNKKYRLVIGVMDADFLHLEKKSVHIPNLFVNLNSKPTNKGINEKMISSIFRIAYTLDHFRKTQLYNDTNQWATDHSCRIY